MSIISPIEEAYQRARIAYHNGEWDECEQALRTLAVHPGEQAFALYNLAILHSQLNRPDWKELYHEAMTCNPDLFNQIGDRTVFKPTPEVDRRLDDKLDTPIDADEVSLL